MPGPSRRFHCRSRGRSPVHGPAQDLVRTGRRQSGRGRRRPRLPPRPAHGRQCRACDAALPPPPRRKPVVPAAVAATSSTSQADTDTLENVIELVRAHKPSDATQARPRYRIRWRESSPNGSSCAAKTMARRSSAIAPSSRPIRAGPRKTSCAGASKRRCGTTIATTPRSGMVRNQSPISAKGKFAWPSHARARRPRRRERLVRDAWRNDGMSEDTESTALDMFGALLTRGRPQGADGHFLYGSEQEAALRAAKRLGSGHVALAKARIAAIKKASNAKALLNAVPRELHSDPGYMLRQDPAAAPRREIRRGRATHAARAEGSRAACIISTNGGSSGGCWRARCSTSANTAPPI